MFKGVRGLVQYIDEFKLQRRPFVMRNEEAFLYVRKQALKVGDVLAAGTYYVVAKPAAEYFAAGGYTLAVGK